MTDRDELGRFTPKAPAPITDPHPTTAIPVFEVTAGEVIDGEVISTEVVALQPNAVALPTPDAVDLDEDHAMMSIQRNRIFRHAIERDVQLPTGELGEPDFEDQAAAAVGTEELLTAFAQLDAARDTTGIAALAEALEAAS